MQNLCQHDRYQMDLMFDIEQACVHCVLPCISAARPIPPADMMPAPCRDLSLPVQSRVMPCAPASADDWKQRTTPPGSAVPAKELWQSPVPLPDTSAGHANTYLPEGCTLDRLLWAIQHLVAAGMYVLVDYHPMFSEQVALDRQQYVDSWAALWRTVTSLPSYPQDLCGRVFLDLLNEPDALGLRWEPAGGKPGAAQCSEPYTHDV